MKKIFTFILASVTSMAAFAVGYTTAGDNSIYTFADLAKIAESGVTVKKAHKSTPYRRISRLRQPTS